LTTPARTYKRGPATAPRTGETAISLLEAGFPADPADVASADLIEPFLAHHRVIVTRRPHGLGFLLELRQLLHSPLLT